ncbi:MAG: DUF2272 domain-containing protein [Rhodospirillales bacterium]|nr:MAG: DUF2272 domain-containing protein [Rhodospirillales bacterium]
MPLRDVRALARRACGAAFVGATLAACAAVAPPREDGGDARDRYQPGARAALLAWLDAEWKRFGDGRRGHVVDLRRVGPPDPPRWTAETPERRHCGRIRAVYWAPLPGGVAHSELTPPERRDPSAPPVCDNAWSAVFVSAALREAGVASRDFRGDALHSAYLRDILRRGRAHEAAPARVGRPLFEAHPVEQRAPEPGDLICASRRRESDAVLRAVFLPAGPRARQAWDAAVETVDLGHCDIVVAVDRRKRTLSAVGGNVQDTVSRSLVPIDDEGRVLRTIERPWFMVVANRLP